MWQWPVLRSARQWPMSTSHAPSRETRIALLIDADKLARRQDRPDPGRTGQAGRGQHPARLRQLEEERAQGLGKGAARMRHPPDPAVRREQRARTPPTCSSPSTRWTCSTPTGPTPSASCRPTPTSLPLVMHLRAKGATVYGFGAKKTPEPFVAACSRFLYLESLGEPDAHDERDDRDAAPEDAPPTGAKAGARKPRAATAAAKKPAAPDLKRDARLVSLLRNAVDTAAGDDGWSNLSAVRTQIANQASFDPRKPRLSQVQRPDRRDRPVRDRTPRPEPVRARQAPGPRLSVLTRSAGNPRSTGSAHQCRS